MRQKSQQNGIRYEMVFSDQLIYHTAVKLKPGGFAPWGMHIPQK